MRGSGLGLQGFVTLDECGPCQMALWVNVFEQPGSHIDTEEGQGEATAPQIPSCVINGKELSQASLVQQARAPERNTGTWLPHRRCHSASSGESQRLRKERRHSLERVEP